jgi:hypothetical protein
VFRIPIRPDPEEYLNLHLFLRGTSTPIMYKAQDRIQPPHPAKDDFPPGLRSRTEPKLLAGAGAGASILKFRLRLQGKLK